AVRHQLPQRPQVLERGDPAGGDDLRVGAGADVTQQVEVGAAQGAVLGDVGDDVALAAGLVEPLEGLPEVPALAGPAAGGEGGAAHGEAHRDAVAVLGEHHGGPLRDHRRCGAEVHAAATGGQGRGEGFVVPDPSGQLDVEVDGGDHLGQQRRVRAAAEGGIEVDQVQPARAAVLEGERGVQRGAVGGLGARLAL